MSWKSEPSAPLVGLMEASVGAAPDVVTIVTEAVAVLVESRTEAA